MSDWRDALMKLHTRGWDSDDIDQAAEAINEACTDGVFEEMEILDLSEADVQVVLDDDAVPDDECAALLIIADLRSRQSADARDLHRALYDLDAFAYEHAGND